MKQSNGVWIFGYGSLMWSPGFEYLEAQMAHLDGYHRDMCILSYVFRGTPEIPGLVMGLNPGGQCSGRAFFVENDKRQDIFDYLHEREMINNVYEPTWLDVRLEDGSCQKAYTFVAVQDHEQYVAHQGLDEKVAYILQGTGQGGSSLEYLENTCQHLRELSIEDGTLEAILNAVKAKITQKL